MKAKTLHEQQMTKLEQLNVALAKETANVEREVNAKLEVSKERLVVKVGASGSRYDNKGVREL